MSGVFEKLRDWYLLVPDGPELGTREQPAMQVCVYTLSFGSLCTHRSVNPRGNASAYTPAKPETVATPDPAVRPIAGRSFGEGLLTPPFGRPEVAT